MAAKKRVLEPADQTSLAAARELAKSHRDPQIKAAMADYVRLADQVAACLAAPKSSFRLATFGTHKR